MGILLYEQVTKSKVQNILLGFIVDFGLVSLAFEFERLTQHVLQSEK